MSSTQKILLVLCLAVSLFASAAYTGFSRTAHAVASAGMQTIVICSASGDGEVITLDRNGERAEDTPQTCAHCADCSLASIAVLAAMAGASGRDAHFSVSLAVSPQFPHQVRPVENPSRGPPSQEMV
ncbi:DUF2946 family protein [Leisingera daeponensis]|uniref:DUF2946 family protein n=1 Tax=Leisingera daeponensis TaxID=405746 RepID=UPI003965812A